MFIRKDKQKKKIHHLIIIDKYEERKKEEEKFAILLVRILLYQKVMLYPPSVKNTCKICWMNWNILTIYQRNINTTKMK